MGEQGIDDRAGGPGQSQAVAAPRRQHSRLIEEYGLIGNLETAALVARDGSIDWLCVPRFDSSAAFAALLGDAAAGSWRLAPTAAARTSRGYRDDTLILETVHETDSGSVRVVDAMLLGQHYPTLVRVVEGLDGTVAMETAIVARFDFGQLPPWTQSVDGGITLTAVGDALVVHADVPLELPGHDVSARFAVAAGEQVAFVMQWFPSHLAPPGRCDVGAALAETEQFWTGWVSRVDYQGIYGVAVRRSLLLLKALTYDPVGACVAAVTTSLPEQLGGSKNWDYRYIWVRDSTFTISAFLNGGLVDEARAWRDWLLRALAGAPENMQIMYGVRGARRIDEYELPHLSGYSGSQPVRIGNAAYTQFQLGIYGETMSAIVLAHDRGVDIDDQAWAKLRTLLEHLEKVWDHPDSGMWESRAKPVHYVQSKVQAWRAFDCAVRCVRDYGFPGPLQHYERLAREIHAQVCERGFDREQNAFVQAYESHELDASVLLIPIVGFLPGDDPRMLGTVAGLERRLMHDGFLYRTSADPEKGGGSGSSGFNASEGAFLACNFWLVENYVLSGRRDDARALFERVLAVASDLGILSEEYDARARRLVGNVPQTFSHAALVNAAMRLVDADSPPSN